MLCFFFISARAHLFSAKPTPPTHLVLVLRCDAWPLRLEGLHVGEQPHPAHPGVEVAPDGVPVGRVALLVAREAQHLLQGEAEGARVDDEVLGDFDGRRGERERVLELARLQ